MPISNDVGDGFRQGLMISSEVAGSGSPAIKKGDERPRGPVFFSSAKRASMRVVISSPRKNIRQLENILVAAA